MALAAGPLTPIKERGEGADGEGGSGDDQQDKGEVWEGTEPLGGTASGEILQICFLHTDVDLEAICVPALSPLLEWRWVLAEVWNTGT